ncbi:MAG: helix-turn-helix transcriptional regulator [Cytophagaceae bacterium]|nr:helix-turn-helix transcriptional regulator [Cytophagaceae bacterium]
MKIFFLFLFTLLFPLYLHAESSADSLLKELDRTLEKRDEYLKTKQEKINFIKKQLVDGEDKSALLVRYSLLDQLFEEYKSFIYDSAFTYGRALLNTAYKLKEDSVINDAKIKISFTLLSAGMFKEALDTLNSIQVDALPKNSKIEYYSILARTYYDLANYSNDSYFSERYDQKGNAYLQQAIELCEPNSIRFLLQKGLWYMRVHDTLSAINTFEQVLKDPKITQHDMAIASSSVSYMYRIAGNLEKAKEYLAKAAIADIISSIRETVAIRDLAEVLYNEGDVERSYKYVKVALEDAYFYGAKHRKIQIANVLPIIEGTQLKIVEGQNRDLFYYSIVATVLVIFIILFSIIIYRQNRKLSAARQQLTLSHQNLEKTNARLAESNFQLGETNNKLGDANKIKEEYIGSFFKLISDYIEKIEKFKNTIDRKMSQKKIEDIRDLVNSMNLKPEREQLYLTFDKTFLKIFPGFVEQFNSLFNPEDQFVLDEKQGLPTELRIFALIRLGISDTEKIAKILDYSVNTIYAYKTRIKNKSIVENEKFEEELMKIRAI